MMLCEWCREPVHETQCSPMAHTRVIESLRTEIEKLRTDLSSTEAAFDQSQRELGQVLDERDATQAECLEQARLLGIGSEREARLVAERNEALAKAAKDGNYAQNAVDKICHYRNLAIVLGAKPEQMLGEFDRKLCMTGIDKDDNNKGYHMSVQDCLDDVSDAWGAYDAKQAEIVKLRAVLKHLVQGAESVALWCERDGRMALKQARRLADEAAAELAGVKNEA